MKNIPKHHQSLALHNNHTKEQQGSPALYCVFFFSRTKCIELENPCWLECFDRANTQAFWESSAALKSSIIGRISPPSMHSESAAGAATMSRRHHSKHCRAQLEQHAVLIFLPHTERKVVQPDLAL